MRSATAPRALTTPPPPQGGAVVYPSDDGEPLAESTLQFDFIERTKGNLDQCIASFVAADLLWYPVEGHPEIRVGPDVMVALGRPKGSRSSYLQWEEEDIPPQVVFEYWSPGNDLGQFARKFAFYQRYGVDEFYLFDEERRYLAGWIRRDGLFTEVEDMNGWVSPALGVRFEWSDGQLTMYRPDGARFLSFAELDQARQDAERARQDAERARQDAERARQDAESRASDAESRASDAESRASDAESRASDAEQRAAALAAKLRALGIEP